MDTICESPSCIAGVKQRRVPFGGGLLRFIGPGFLVAVGYMDPGNWATDLAAGSAHEYRLLWVVMLASGAAMLLQFLAAKLGLATGLDLAQACRARYTRYTSFMLWLLCEAAIVACDLAEIIGAGIAFQLLFGLPLVAGILLASVLGLFMLSLQGIGVRWLEAAVGLLMFVVVGCLVYEVAIMDPAIDRMARGFIPDFALLRDNAALYLAVGILGATVMPHNLYLHSSIVKSRANVLGPTQRSRAIRYAGIDSMFALAIAFVVNAAILVMAAAAFHDSGVNVTELHQAFASLSADPGPLAGILFAVALLAASQNSVTTATLAGQIVMSGFLGISVSTWIPRLVTRLLAVIPAVAVALIAGAHGITSLLILSQVLLSLQLPFAIVPLLRMTDDPAVIGVHANGRAMKLAAWTVALVIIFLDLWLVYDTCSTFAA